MIPYDTMRKSIASGLGQHLGVPVIRGNQTAQAPSGSYVIYNVTTIAGANNGTWQKHADGIDRLMVRSIWSFSTLSTDYEESVSLAIKAREWFEHTGRVWLADRGITVQSTTEINNRDNILTVEYERKNGFDVVFYVFDEVADPVEEYITEVETTHEVTT